MPDAPDCPPAPPPPTERGRRDVFRWRWLWPRLAAHSDPGRDIEVLADMSTSRLAGSTGHVRTEDAFLRLFDRYRADRVIPGGPVAR